MHETRVQAIGVVGTGIRSWNLPNSLQVAGITVDNKSGSWLWIPQDNTYIAPYTLGFAHSFAPTFARVDILFSDGPAGQVSTLQGEGFIATLYDQRVAESAGQVSSEGNAFIQRFTPVQQTFSFIIVRSTINTNGVLVAGVVGLRPRLLTLGVALRMYGSIGLISDDVYAESEWLITDIGTGNIVETGIVGPLSPVTQLLYPEGNDFDPGTELQYTFVGTQTHDLRASLKATYQML